MDWSRLDLGVGIIALGSLDQVWSGIEDLVDVVEVEPQTLWPTRVRGGLQLSPEPLAWLRSCGRPLICHGVGFPVGGTTAPDPDGVAMSAASMKTLGAVHWSEHLAFNLAGDAYAGFLLPPVQTPTAVKAAIRHIADYRRIDDRPFLVETPTNYLQPVDGDLGDGEYVAAIAEGADCGILLDLHNVWTNERNGRQSVEDFVAALPLERVWEMHLAGGFETNGYYLDAHVGPIDPELLALAAHIVPRLPRLRAIIYEAIPISLAAQGTRGLHHVLASMHEIADLPPQPSSVASAATAPLVPAPLLDATPAVAGRGATVRTVSTEAREAELLAFTTRKSTTMAADDPGAQLIRSLTDQARLSLLVRDHEATLRALIAALGPDAAEAVLTEFLVASRASIWRDEQSRAFTEWLAVRPDLCELVA
ncbi:MAG: hypothetical protein JWM12_3174 [Ilumatobacteraceae bacterium]|nr:hypothetical protein [Ilumatobacteraceae bacterium]